MTLHPAVAPAAAQPFSANLASERWMRWSRSALSASAAFWLIVMLAGQAVFAAYVAVFYGGAIGAGDVERWNKVLPKGYGAGDAFGNAVLALHLFFAVAWVLSGVIQLVPAIRRHVPALHRWNGRLYLGCSAVLALGGLWLVWVRGGVVGDVGSTWPSASTRSSSSAVAPRPGKPPDPSGSPITGAGRSGCSWPQAASGSSASG